MVNIVISSIQKKDNEKLRFIPNMGQIDPCVDFYTTMYGSHFYFQNNKITTQFYSKKEKAASIHKVVLDLTFIDADALSTPIGLNQNDGYFNYIYSGLQEKNHINIPNYDKLQYKNLWEGIDLELYGDEHGLKYNWLLRSPELLEKIRFKWTGVQSITFTHDKGLCIKHAEGSWIDPSPVAWQELNGENIPVTCEYQMNSQGEIGFKILGEYDCEAPLIIDPLIQYATFLGGNGIDTASSIAVDCHGYIYVIGTTLSNNFPVTDGAFQTFPIGTSNVFVTKFAPDGIGLIYSTYLGGSERNVGFDISLDKCGCAYITGYTTSKDFPVTPCAFQTQNSSDDDIGYISKLSSDGSYLVYSSYLGGGKFTLAAGIKVDDCGCAYVTGTTYATDFPVTPYAFQTKLNGVSSAFLTKISPDGRYLIYSSYFGGDNFTSGSTIGLDDLNHAYIAGGTNSIELPVTPGAFQTQYGGGVDDGYIAKFACDGSSLIYSTYLGGSLVDMVVGIQVNEDGTAAVIGATASSNFPVTAGAFQTTLRGDVNVFVSILSADGRRLKRSTYLGGSNIENGNSIDVDSQRNVYVTGITLSDDFPITPEILPSHLSGSSDAFVTILTPDLNQLVLSYYLGGSNEDAGNKITVGCNGTFYVVGTTSSSDFPVSSDAFQTAYGGGASDAFLTKSTFFRSCRNE
ncbi:SBBP repeat-containing protein [Anaerocolumna sp. AGMB13020]|uniref:DUF7948 domain-containing protein n=1 Tax=Anaerocolumna sp. AGMB13020 TaxID=3081750 RepID=UPI0029549136|nr:SBBP repeat-containing protein [Anaerocolumna sp. AGMB13020]WOO35280.1 SBBP repeat-containing protein [Anaerocolumna sp. AGMB13020]